jgi:hypothetical protein
VFSYINARAGITTHAQRKTGADVYFLLDNAREEEIEPSLQKGPSLREEDA